MSLYVFFNSDAQDDKVLTAAKKAARSHGATVVKSLAGTMLLEVTPAQVPEVAQASPGWALRRQAQDGPGAEAQAAGALQGARDAGGGQGPDPGR
jgi:hypothetical protein